MITEEMTNKLIDIFKNGKIEGFNRKKLKFIVDSLIDQVAKGIGLRSNGVLNIRREINQKLCSTECLNKEFLNSFNNLLRKYNDVFSKDYSDHKDAYRQFLNNEFKNFVEQIIGNEMIENCDLSQKLGVVL